MNNLSKRLKELRATRGISQEHLADVARVSLRTIQRIESNESKPTKETIKRVSLALEVELKELMGSNLTNQTCDLKTTLVFLKNKLSKTNQKSEIKIFKEFIKFLMKLKRKDLSTRQLEEIEEFIQYLELERIPCHSNEMFKKKSTQLKAYLKKKLRFVPNNYYATLAVNSSLPFTVGFFIQRNRLDHYIIIGVICTALALIWIGTIIDLRMKRRGRSFPF